MRLLAHVVSKVDSRGDIVAPVRMKPTLSSSVWKGRHVSSSAKVIMSGTVARTSLPRRTI